MIPLAVLKQAGLTDGMVASLTASELAGALPTDGGAVEPPVPYVDTFANGGARSLDALAVKGLKADGARGARSEPFFAIAEVRMDKPAAAAAVSGAEVAPRTGGPRRKISEM